MTKAFCGCGKEISPKTRSGRCLRCAAADPAVRAKKGKITDEQRAQRSEAIRKLNDDPVVVAKRNAALAVYNADPAVRARQSETARKTMAWKMQDPAFAAQMRESGRRLQTLNPLNDPAVRQQSTLRRRRQVLSWCPEEFWDLNFKLKRGGILLDERKRIILEQVPGTPEHARLSVQNSTLNMQLKHERDIASRY
jgi:hypothetical protein